MFKKLHFVLLLFSAVLLTAQENYNQRSAATEDLAPFYHGVASGDPTPNAVIIWTRVTTTSTGPIVGTWRVATDTSMANIVQQGSFATDSTRDYTVKVDVTGLQPNTWYFYEFEYENKYSLRGRTKTAPIGGVDQMRFAFVSCSNYPSGYFNAYDRIWERNDVDAVLHLGDYIYEYGGNDYGTTRKDQLPNKEIVTLEDYRLRHSTYKLDPSLRTLHQNYPFITVWDDHETANNSYKDGAQNHTPGIEGNWYVRKSNGQRAYDEWLPIRLPEPENVNKIWRKYTYGNLVDIFMLDTRLYDRSYEDINRNDTTKKLLGDEQMEWLKNGLINSTAKWKVLGQQVMVGNLDPFGLVINNDQWDGYPTERKKLYDIILNNNIKNVIVLTGDIHTAWAMDLPYNKNNYNANTGAGSVAVEFVCASITSPASPVPLEPLYPIVPVVLPHIKYVDLFKKGYGILDLKQTQAQGDFYSVNRIDILHSGQRFERGYFTLENTRWIKRTTQATTKLLPNIYLAPKKPRVETTTPIKNNNLTATILGVYPNPFVQDMYVQFNLFETSDVDIELVDMSGNIVYQKSKGILQKGLYNETLNIENIASGIYKLIIRSGKDIIQKSVQKF